MKNLILIVLLTTTVAHSQSEKYERIKALKTAYITEQLALTPSEAEKFWPIYNGFEAKIHKLKREKYSGIHKQSPSEMENLSDGEANKLIDEFLRIETARLDLQKEKINALRKVISPVKIVGLRKAEDNFKRELLDRYRRGKEQKEKPGQRKP